MTELKIKEIADDKPVKMILSLPADIHRDLITYATLLSNDERAVDPTQLIAPMLRKFMMSDREFARARKKGR